MSRLDLVSPRTLTGVLTPRPGGALFLTGGATGSGGLKRPRRSRKERNKVRWNRRRSDSYAITPPFL